MSTARKLDESVSNTKPITDKVSSIAHETVDRAAEQVGNAEEALRETASSTAENIADRKESVELEVGTAANKARKVIVENPLVAASAAFTLGFLVTSLLTKKS